MTSCRRPAGCCRHVCAHGVHVSGATRVRTRERHHRGNVKQINEQPGGERRADKVDIVSAQPRLRCIAMHGFIGMNVNVNVNVSYSRSCPAHDARRPRLLQSATLEEEQ